MYLVGLDCRLSNSLGLEAAVEAAAEFLNKAVKPVMVAGPNQLMLSRLCKELKPITIIAPMARTLATSSLYV